MRSANVQEHKRKTVRQVSAHLARAECLRARVLCIGVAVLFLATAPFIASPPAEESEHQRLLAPAALKNSQSPVGIEEIRRNFQDPPAEFRTAPLWVWNDEMNPDRIKEQLRQFKEQGMGGVFVHPRPGLITEYLGSEWFELWKTALDESKRLGLLCNIYDENSYPSGFAGGHVPALAPDTVVQYVEARFADEAPEDNGPSMLGVFRVERDEKGRVNQPPECRRERARKSAGPSWSFPCATPAAARGPASSRTWI